tara:strand:- start:7706 stop:8797 length:1092 start_codon:yes stop_codon:yes gene_type:complete
MNDEINTTDTATQALTIPHQDDISAWFSVEGKVVAQIELVKKAVDATVTDISTDKGRKAVKSLAALISRTKTGIDAAGKSLNDDRNRLNGEVNAIRKIAKEELEALQAKVKAPVIAWENAEAERVRLHLLRMDEFDQGRIDAHSDVLTIKGVIEYVTTLAINDTWEEYEADAKVAKSQALDKWGADLAIAQQREEAAAELDALRAEKEARAEADAKAAEDKAAKDKAEADRQAAEAQAEAVRQAEEAKVKAAEVEATRKAQEATQAKLDAAEAERVAAEAKHAQELTEAKEAAERKAQAERDQQAADKAAEAELLAARAANTKHVRKIRTGIIKAIADLNAESVDEIVDALMGGKIENVEVKL